MASSTETVQQINVGVWHNDLRAVYNTAPIGPGALALLQVCNLQLEQAATWVEGLSGDVFVQRGLGSFEDDFAATVEQLRACAVKYTEIAASSDPREVRYVAIQNFVAGPILDGRYPAPMVASLPRIGQRGIYVLPDGSGKGFGIAYRTATLWNQAVVAADVDARLGRETVPNAIRRMLSRAAVQVEVSAPGEDPTLRDVTADSLRTLADAPGAILRAVTGGLGPLLLGGVVVAGVLYLLLRE